MTTQEIVEEIKTKTAVELNELVKALEEEFGVSAAAAVVAGPAAAAEAAPAAAPRVSEIPCNQFSHRLLWPLCGCR